MLSKPLKWSVNIVLIFLCLLTAKYSSDHYADGGCDGGLCGLAYLSHGLPLLTVWIIQIIAFNQSFQRRIIALVLTGIALVLNSLVYFQDYGYRHTELYLEPEIIYGLSAITLLIYFFGASLGITRESDPSNKKTAFEKVFSACLLLWLLYQLVAFGRLLKLLLMDNVKVSDVAYIFYFELGFLIVAITCIPLIFRKQVIAHYILICVLAYPILQVVYNLITKDFFHYLKVTEIVFDSLVVFFLVWNLTRIKKITRHDQT